MALPAIPAGFDDLSPDEKIEYIQGLWERVVAHPEEVPAEDWQGELVTERLAAYRSGETTTRPWRKIRDDLRASLRPRR
jgi:putative addiction module component (TIGR02574 family)